MKSSLIKYILLISLFAGAGCKKLVDVKAPITTINSQNVFTVDATAIAALNGIYAQMSNNSFLNNGITSMSLDPSLSADELTLYPNVTSAASFYYTNSLSSATFQIGNDFWFDFYPVIYDVNAALEGLNNSNSLTPAVKQQLLGEAKFIRAFCYFYLVNLYGDVPLITTTNYKINATLSRTSTKLVYQQIVSDLEDAQSLLSADYLDVTLLHPTPDRIRPTRWAASALLARTYLYESDWTDAVTSATTVINSSSFKLTALNDVFLANSNEAIWQLQPVINGFNTQDALLFILPPNGPDNSNNPVYLSNFLLNAFEPGDQRASDWIDSLTTNGTTYHYAYKYKSATLNAGVTEYEMVLRLGELYLIRAEAEANGNQPAAAVNDINVIRERAGLSDYIYSSQNELLAAILRERQVELFTEWGHRWLDLKRTGNVNTVMSTVTPKKHGTWVPTKALYPIPFTEIQADPALTQNPGY